MKDNSSRNLTMLVITSRPLLCKKKNLNGKEVIEQAALLDIYSERRILREALKAAEIPIEATFLSEATSIQLGRALNNQYDIVHFTGHGTSDGMLLLEDGNGWGYPIDPIAFRNLFKKNQKFFSFRPVFQKIQQESFWV